MESTSDQSIEIMECARKIVKNQILNRLKEKIHAKAVNKDQNCFLKQVKYESLTNSNKQQNASESMSNETKSIPSIEVFTITGALPHETNATLKGTGIHSVKIEPDCEHNWTYGDHQQTDSNPPVLPKSEYLRIDSSIKEEKLDYVGEVDVKSKLEFPYGNIVDSSRLSLNDDAGIENKWYQDIESSPKDDFTVQQTLKELISCNKCDFKCELNHDLKVHKIVFHQRGYAHTCKLCKYVTAKRNALEQHIKSNHANIKLKTTTGIDNMDIISSSQDASTVQQTPQISQGLISCIECDFKCDLRRDLRIHKIVFHQKMYPHPCEFCKFVTSKKDVLENHIKIRHEKGKSCYSCGHCEKTFDKKYLFKRHQASHVTYSCQLCDYTCKYSGLLKSHNKFVHQKVKKFFCNLCDFACLYSFRLKYHVRNVHEAPKSRVCTECDRTFKTGANLKQHVRVVHRKIKNFSCDLCSYESYKQCVLERHIARVHHKMKPHLCETCGKSYAGLSYLKAHIAHVHVRKRPFICSECNKAFKRPDHLKTHMWKMHKIGNPIKSQTFTCSNCSKVFTTQHNMRIHIRNKHDIESNADNYALMENIESVHEKRKAYKCPYPECKFATANQSNLNVHVKSLHENKKRYNCDLCDFGCSSQFTMRRHIAEVHEKSTQKPYVCSICDFSTFYKNSLLKHDTFVHCGSREVKEFLCHFCDLKLTTRHNLNNHISHVHHKLRPHKCGQCNRSFAQVGNLKSHIRVVHDKIHEFACQICDYSTSHRGNLKKHIARYHSKLDSGVASSTLDSQGTIIEEQYTHSGENENGNTIPGEEM